MARGSTSSDGAAERPPRRRPGRADVAERRLRDLEVPNYLGGHALIGVVAQRLVRKVCPECSVPDVPGAEDWERLALAPRDLGPRVKAVGAGCPACHYAGYSGRVGVFEVLRLDDALRELVVNGASEADLWRAARARGFRTLMDDALAKVAEGITTLEEVARVVPLDAWSEVAPVVLPPVVAPLAAPAVQAAVAAPITALWVYAVVATCAAARVRVMAPAGGAGGGSPAAVDALASMSRAVSLCAPSRSGGCAF